MEKVIKLLEPCEQLTKDLSKDDSTISMVIPGYNVLRQTLLCADDRGVQTIKQSLLESLDSRFIPYTTNVMYAAATILDPRFKTQFVNQSMLRHAREFIESKMNLQDQPVQAQVDSSSPVPAKKSMWDFLNDADSNEPEKSIAVPTEFDSYLTQKKLPHSSNALKYCKENTQFVGMKAVARMVLAIPPTSVRSGRVFSISGNVNSERRNRLRPDISEKLVVLHDNLLILKK